MKIYDQNNNHITEKIHYRECVVRAVLCAIGGVFMGLAIGGYVLRMVAP